MGLATGVPVGLVDGVSPVDSGVAVGRTTRVVGVTLGRFGVEVALVCDVPPLPMPDGAGGGSVLVAVAGGALGTLQRESATRPERR